MHTGQVAIRGTAVTVHREGPVDIIMQIIRELTARIEEVLDRTGRKVRVLIALMAMVELMAAAAEAFRGRDLKPEYREKVQALKSVISRKMRRGTGQMPTDADRVKQGAEKKLIMPQLLRKIPKRS